MSANIGLVNWQGIAQSNWTWISDLWYPTSDQAWKFAMEGRLAMTAYQPFEFLAGTPGYDSWVNCFIRVRFWNQVGSLVYDSGKWPCWLINGKYFQFDMVSHVLAEVAGASIFSKQLKFGSSLENMPVATVLPVGQQAQVYITGQNNGASPALLGLNYTVKRLDGSTAQTVSDQSSYVDAGGQYLFGPFSSFALDVAGTWTITIALFIWNGSSWIQTDSWQGTLCSVQAGALTKPVLLSPANGSTVGGTVVTFRWNAVAGAVNYWLYVYKSGGQVLISQLVGNTAQYDVSGFIQDGGTYSWVLWAIDAAGGSSPQSDIWSFINNAVAGAQFSNLAVSYIKI